jgi:16S rRNA (uracil1498-N3)-methyltransferase
MNQNRFITLPRLYVASADFSAEQNIELSSDSHHYLRNVMRKEVGDQLRVFNGYDGEWLAEISKLDKKSAEICLKQKMREQTKAIDLSLCISPIKKERLEWVVEKISEIGLKKICLVKMDRSTNTNINLERLQAIAVSSAEQSERLNIIEIEEIDNLKSLESFGALSHRVCACLERASVPRILQAQDSLKKADHLSILIGPEGGFSPEEQSFLLSSRNVIPVSLGETILRSETAAIVAAAQVMAAL